MSVKNLTGNDLKVMLLKKAASRIKSGRSNFICFALSDVTRTAVEGECRARNELVGLIANRLGRHSYYHYWLKANHPKVFRQSLAQGPGPHLANMREARLQWLAALIQEFSAKAKQ